MEFIFPERKGTEDILNFIKELAEYENLLDEVVADTKTLEHWLFDEKRPR